MEDGNKDILICLVTYRKNIVNNINKLHRVLNTLDRDIKDLEIKINIRSKIDVNN